MTNSKRITYESLSRFFQDALMAVGVPEHVAQVEAEIGAEVDLCGVHSHGVRLLITMVDHLRNGRTNPNPQIKTLVDFPASVLMETDRGIGRYVSAVGMDMAIERAQLYGVGTVVIRGVAHWGRGFSYGLRAARAGMIGLAFTNAIANFPAWGTAQASLGNNPIGIGIPADEDDDPVVLDIALTQTAIGRVRDAALAGERIPLGWGLDAAGRPTDDPNAVMASGRFMPMGGHKGSGLSFVTDLITGGLAGGLLCFEQGTQGRPSDTEGGSTKMFIAIKPFGDWLGERVATLKQHIHAMPPAPEQGSVQWPGEGSFRRRADYWQNGIALPEKLVEDIEALSQELSVPVSWI